MYADFFGFRELPFNNTPDPRFFYPTPDHEEALASLIYATTERKGFVLLTGEVGAGKTLMTRMLIRHFGEAVAFANINHAVQSPDDLMEAICTEFELPIDPSAGETRLVRTLHDYLLEQFARNIPVVLVLDEAQNIPLDAFERLRMIGNLESDDAKLLQVAIVGQPELKSVFSTPRLRQLRQRVFRSFHLPALSRKATAGYIHHRLRVVTDTADEIFSADAIEAIYGASGGLPRVVNTICDNALLSAYSADRRTIDARFVESVVEQMMLGEAGENTQRAEPVPRTRRNQQQSPTTSQPSKRTRSSRARSASPRNDGQERREENRKFEQLDVLREDLGADRRRLDALEANILSISPYSRESEAAHDKLATVVREANAILERSKAATLELSRREETARNLDRSIGTSMGDLHQLLLRVSQTAEKSKKADREARTVLDGLSNQVSRAQEMMGHLSRKPLRHDSVPPTPARKSNAQSDDIAHAGPVRQGEERPIAPRRMRRSIAETLACVRENVAELRSLGEQRSNDRAHVAASTRPAVAH